MREYTKKPENQSHTLDSNPRASRQAPISEILQAYKNGTLGKQSIQRESIEDEELLQSKRSGQAPVNVILQRYKESIQRNVPEEDEELLQGKFDTAQRTEIGIDEEKLLQGKFESDIQTEQEPIQREEKSNNTGLPDNLKTGIENLSGYSMDDVKVHYNSDKPAQLSALAYAQGTDIHVAPGQEKHLPHEAWHVVQQKQGRVQPTMQLQGLNVNDNEGLEKEADKLPKQTNFSSQLNTSIQLTPYTQRCIQKTKEDEIGKKANLGIEVELRGLIIHNPSRNWDEGAGLEVLTEGGPDGVFTTDQHQGKDAIIEWGSNHPPFSKTNQGSIFEEKLAKINSFVKNGKLTDFINNLQTHVNVGQLKGEYSNVTLKKGSGNFMQTQVNIEVPFENIGKITTSTQDSSNLFNGVKSTKAKNVFIEARVLANVISDEMISTYSVHDDTLDLANVKDNIASLLTIFLHTEANSLIGEGKDVQGVLFKTGAGDLARLALNDNAKKILWYCVHKDDVYIERIAKGCVDIYEKVNSAIPNLKRHDDNVLKVKNKVLDSFKVTGTSFIDEKKRRWGDELTGYNESVIGEYEALYLSGVKTGKFFNLQEHSSDDHSLKKKFIIAEIRRLDNEINEIATSLSPQRRKVIAEKIKKLQKPN